MAVSSTITFPVFKILDFAAMYIFFRIHWTFVLKIAFLVEYWHIKCVKRHETVSKQQTILWRTIIKKYDLGWYILCNLECLHRQTRARVVLYTCRDPSCYTGDCWSSTYLKCDKFVLCQDTGGDTRWSTWWITVFSNNMWELYQQQYCLWPHIVSQLVLKWV